MRVVKLLMIGVDLDLVTVISLSTVQTIFKGLNLVCVTESS